jgi:hypothetical protein
MSALRRSLEDTASKAVCLPTSSTAPCEGFGWGWITSAFAAFSGRSRERLLHHCGMPLRHDISQNHELKSAVTGAQDPRLCAGELADLMLS